ncbi:MAG: flagellar motor switch protein FliM [Deltaproteobacteria bacterium DG_8]|nr:MAG: flagellar motor switch protein FliM [Deltaproteobacteria bacterium DG_8]
MSKVLSQDEVDALLKGISGGEIETEGDKSADTSGLKVYDLTSQEKIVRGRMPILELINDRFTRLIRSSLSSSLRKPVGATVISNEMMKYGDFLKALPVPTSLHIFRMEPLRGNIILVLESKLVFCLVDIFFGGSGAETFKVEGREFTSIENRLVNKIVKLMIDDLKEAWKNIQPISLHFVRSEVNPQFATIVSSDEIVIIISFELEMESTTGKVTLCIPYATLEPIKDKLQGGVKSEQLEADTIWAESFRMQLRDVPVEVVVELGKAVVRGKEMLNLNVGDVIQLDTYSNDKLKVRVGGIVKFMGYPGSYKGSQALQISTIFERRY